MLVMILPSQGLILTCDYWHSQSHTVSIPLFNKLLLPLLNFLGPKLFDSNSTITVLEWYEDVTYYQQELIIVLLTLAIRLSMPWIFQYGFFTPD